MSNAIKTLLCLHSETIYCLFIALTVKFFLLQLTFNLVLNIFQIFLDSNSSKSKTFSLTIQSNIVFTCLCFYMWGNETFATFLFLELLINCSQYFNKTAGFHFFILRNSCLKKTNSLSDESAEFSIAKMFKMFSRTFTFF